MSRIIKQKLEAVKDFDGAASLDADDATENPERRRRGGGGGGVRRAGGLRFDTSVVIGYVEHD